MVKTDIIYHLEFKGNNPSSNMNFIKTLLRTCKIKKTICVLSPPWKQLCKMKFLFLKKVITFESFRIILLKLKTVFQTACVKLVLLLHRKHFQQSTLYGSVIS